MISAFRSVQWSRCPSLKPGTHTTLPDGDIPWKCMSEIIPGLFLTCEEELRDRETCMLGGISLVLNLCGGTDSHPFEAVEISEGTLTERAIDSLNAFVEELEEYTNAPVPQIQQRKVFVHTVPAIDTPSYDIGQHFPLLCTLIALVMNKRTNGLSGDAMENHGVGVHCMVGVSRSASIVCAYLMKLASISRDEALVFMQTVRPVVNPNPGFQKQLLLWECTLFLHIVDDLSAELASWEIQNSTHFMDTLLGLVPVLVTNGKCSAERQKFGFLIRNSHADTDDVLTLYRQIHSSISTFIKDEMYTDSPVFFGNICELSHSMSKYCPEALRLAGPDCTWSDSFFDQPIRDLGRSDYGKDPLDTARAFCSLLDSVNKKHCEGSLPQLLCTGDAVEGISVPIVRLSVCFLPYISCYAEGFVSFEEQNRLTLLLAASCNPDGSEYCVVPQGQNRLIDLAILIFCSSFLATPLGEVMLVSSDLDEMLREQCGEKRAHIFASIRSSRWRDGSCLGFLRDDIEVQSYEVVEQAFICTTAVRNLPDLMQVLHEKVLVASPHNFSVARVCLEKILAGIFSFRLQLESTLHFVRRTLEELCPKEYLMLHFPMDVIEDYVHFSEGWFCDHYGEQLNLRNYFLRELEPLSCVAVA